MRARSVQFCYLYLNNVVKHVDSPERASVQLLQIAACEPVCELGTTTDPIQGSSTLRMPGDMARVCRLVREDAA